MEPTGNAITKATTISFLLSIKYPPDMSGMVAKYPCLPSVIYAAPDIVSSKISHQASCRETTFSKYS
jgi:hypothetical protein